jgi:hypothetical protein
MNNSFNVFATTDSREVACWRATLAHSLAEFRTEAGCLASSHGGLFEAGLFF